MPTAPVPPQNLDAEESVIGAMMLSSKAIDAVADTNLTAADFYRASHGVVFDAIMALTNRGEPADAITVVAELHRAGRLADWPDGAERVHELSALVPAASNAAHYARIVKETATARGLVVVGNALRELGFSRHGTEEEMLGRAEEAVFGLSQQRHTTEFVDLPTMFGDEYRRILSLHEAGSDVVGTPTGYRSLDRLTGGLQGGQLIILAARPSMGKSALALCIAANLVLRLERNVAMFSLEMSRSELMQRVMAVEARIDAAKLRIGQVAAADWARLHRLGDLITRNEHRFVIDDNGAVTLPEIRSKLRREHARRPLSLVVIDYLQLMTDSNAKISERVQEVSRISRGLKVLARELDVPILALSQLNRGPENRVSDHRPILSDLRESGSIEQDADIVFFVYRDEYYNKETTDPGMAEIICAKNRNGPTDTVKLAFQKTYTRFAESRYESEEEPS